MKKVILLLFIAMTAATVYGKTLRVNNATGSGAPYTTVDDALAAASDGDIIILEASVKSYGDFTVGKTVTIQGEGYWRDINGISQEGAAATEVENITVTADGAKISSLWANRIRINSNRAIVTRCHAYFIYLGEDYSSNPPVTNCIIHQNILSGIKTDTYSPASENIQITNNIFYYRYDGDIIVNLKNSVIRRNTFRTKPTADPLMWVKHSIVENNIGGKYNTESSNTYSGNISRDSNNDNFRNDKTVKEFEESLNVDAGAFSGEDPYVLSGIAPGPRIIDLTVPESVEQGEDLRVTVKIGSSK